MELNRMSAKYFKKECMNCNFQYDHKYHTIDYRFRMDTRTRLYEYPTTLTRLPAYSAYVMK